MTHPLDSFQPAACSLPFHARRRPFGHSRGLESRCKVSMRGRRRAMWHPAQSDVARDAGESNDSPDIDVGVSEEVVAEKELKKGEEIGEESESPSGRSRESSFSEEPAICVSDECVDIVVDEGEEEVALELPEFRSTESSEQGEGSPSVATIDGEEKGRHTPVVTEVVSKFVEALLAKNSAIERETLHSAIQDCYGRFILNLPYRYLSNHIQLCFAIQEAFWWYDDYWFERMPTALPKLSMRNFGFLLCELCPLLRLYFNSEAYASLMSQWRQYCCTIPLKGAILVNSTLTKVLMVQSWRGGRWMFPRGKVDEQEDDAACAVREVKEEIGVDVSKIINSEIYIETNIDEQPIKLYIIPGVLETTPFGPRKRKEIGRIRWISLDKLPGWHRFAGRRLRAIQAKQTTKETPATDKKASSVPAERLRFWNVYPFVEALAGWMDLLLKGSKNRKSYPYPMLATSDLSENWTSTKIGTLGFSLPPLNFNEVLLERYNQMIAEEGFADLTNSKLAKHPDDHEVLAFYREQKDLLAQQAAGSPRKKTKKKMKSSVLPLRTKTEQPGLNPVGFSSIAASQPAEAKLAPLPPFIEENTIFKIPPHINVQQLHKLQHPAREVTDASRHTRHYLEGGYKLLHHREHKHLGNVSSKLAEVVGRDINISLVEPKRILTRADTAGQHLLEVLQGASEPASILTEIGVLGQTGFPPQSNVKPRSILQDFQRLGLQVGGGEETPPSIIQEKSQVVETSPGQGSERPRGPIKILRREERIVEKFTEIEQRRESTNRWNNCKESKNGSRDSQNGSNESCPRSEESSRPKLGRGRRHGVPSTRTPKQLLERFESRRMKSDHQSDTRAEEPNQEPNLEPQMKRRERPVTDDTSIKEVLHLAHVAYQAANTCRERIGRRRLPIQTFIKILGLLE